MKKLYLLAIVLSIVGACSATKVYRGTVLNVERGKDGYTASLVNSKGEKFDAVLSIPKMETNFRVLKIDPFGLNRF